MLSNMTTSGDGDNGVETGELGRPPGLVLIADTVSKVPQAMCEASARATLSAQASKQATFDADAVGRQPGLLGCREVRGGRQSGWQEYEDDLCGCFSVRWAVVDAVGHG